MSFGFILQSSLEIIGFAALVVALIFEDKIAHWEERMIKRIKRKFSRRNNVIPFDRCNSDGRAV